MGLHDWNVVASELNSRTIYRYHFTPQILQTKDFSSPVVEVQRLSDFLIVACKAKYEDLQRRYSGCNAWFDELRKRRVEELKRELEKSESSIGSLVTKIESLKAEKERSAQIDSGSSHSDSPAAIVGKDGISASSFTLDSTRTEFESHAVGSAKEIDSKLECSESCEQDEVPSTSKPSETAEGNGGALRKRRGKRKRKDAVLDVKGSIGESDNVCSISGISASNCKETSTSSDQSIKPTSREDNKGGLSRLIDGNSMAIFNSVIQNEVATVFRVRHDSQKRARYKEKIKQHMDVETRTREHKLAMALRDIVSKAYHDHYKSSYHTAATSLLTFSATGNLPVKPRSARPRPSKVQPQAKSCKNLNSIAETLGGDDHKPSDADSKARLQSSLAAKKGFKGHRKLECGSMDGSVTGKTKEDHRSEVVTKERKRTRKGDL